ncbi:MAG: copper chaperone PCu(A)C [Chloroflexi bacterium]|nr:copper chaperone PCu(A)C [Chloroflexota bacterium]
MKNSIVLILMGMLLLSACGSEGRDVEAHDYWTRAALKDGNGVVYMLLHNHSSQDDALVGVSSDAALTGEIHLSQMNSSGVMEMTRQESIPLPVDAEVELKPGGYHIMLIGLKKDLNVGDKIMVTLHFMHHADIVLTVPVLDAANMGGSGMDGMP